MTDYSHITPATAKKVQVNWEDIYFSDNWNEDEPVQPIESSTLGWLLEETDTMIIVAGSYDWRNSQWATIHAISKVAPQVVFV